MCYYDYDAWGNYSVKGAATGLAVGLGIATGAGAFSLCGGLQALSGAFAFGVGAIIGAFGLYNIPKDYVYT